MAAQVEPRRTLRARLFELSGDSRGLARAHRVRRAFLSPAASERIARRTERDDSSFESPCDPIMLSWLLSGIGAVGGSMLCVMPCRAPGCSWGTFGGIAGVYVCVRSLHGEAAVAIQRDRRWIHSAASSGSASPRPSRMSTIHTPRSGLESARSSVPVYSSRGEPRLVALNVPSSCRAFFAGRPFLTGKTIERGDARRT